MKSCCLQKNGALPLEGDLKEYRQGQPVTLSGIYVEGKFQVKNVKQESLSFPYVTVGILLAACVAATLYKLLKASSSSLKR